MCRSYSLSDSLCFGIDRALRALLNNPVKTGRPSPAIDAIDARLTASDRRHAAGLMRVNHTGEVCAQALYHGQHITAHSASIKQQMEHAALEEGDHLAWCAMRLAELDSHTSYLNVLWYLGSFGMGFIAGAVGDRWSLGFVAETEHQVVQHLEKHCALLPSQDKRSLCILEAMKADEKKHQQDAMHAGAAPLPPFIKQCMTFASKIMVKTAYRL